MKVILKQEVADLGEVDSVIDVAAGYGRNYLIPRRLAVFATAKEIAAAQKRQAEKEKQLEAQRSEFEAWAAKLSTLELTITVDAGAGGKLFGSVTAQDIAQAVQKATQVTVDKHKIKLPEPIKNVGHFEVPLKIYKEIDAKLQIQIVAK